MQASLAMNMPERPM